MLTGDKFWSEDVSALITKTVLIGTGLVRMLTVDKFTSYIASASVMLIAADAVFTRITNAKAEIK